MNNHHSSEAFMIKAYALRFHRWVTLLFALPLIVLIVTGLVLSFEPLAQQAKLDAPLTKAAVLGYLRALTHHRGRGRGRRNRD
jgi:Ni,Fe-hydrogenase I cytochrome b subunit